MGRVDRVMDLCILRPTNTLYEEDVDVPSRRHYNHHVKPAMWFHNSAARRQ